MKSIASIIVALLAFVLTTGCSAKKQFADIASNDDVTSVYISKTMLKMAGSVGGDLSDDINVKALIKDLDSIEILTCENASKVKKIAPVIEQRIAALKADVLMDANEDNENVIIYGTPDPQNENKISNLIIYTRESGELNLVVLSGTIDMAQVSSMISKERLQ